VIPEKTLKSLSIKNDKKIVLLVMDGIGDLPRDGKTCLESANTPHLDALARNANTGLCHPISMGITPGSGPAHLSLFGYDPLEYDIGRGVLEALGIDFELTQQDIAARANFATVDADGVVTDRRAGRIATERNDEICQFLSSKIKRIEDVQVFIRSGKEHRFVVVFRGQGLHDDVTDTDPQETGRKPLACTAMDDGSEKTARIVNSFVHDAVDLLSGFAPANYPLLRGIAKHPAIPTMQELFKLTPAAIATYPMYRGLARLVGMEVLSTGSDIASEVESLKEHWKSFDFFYLHIKKTDSFGEDGDFCQKIAVIEEMDHRIPDILSLNPDCLVVTGDHSTPCIMKAHSWHPVPFLLSAPYLRRDPAQAFTEFECANGILGNFGAVNAMPLMLAHTLKLRKYGA
jgi:2,3-bisphosphoglycerate-independent phosphoglycerate mutase